MANEKQLEQMKQKYAPVLTAMKQQQVQISHVHIQDDRLIIQGVAPSEQAKNKVWDQIKQVNPNWAQELIADIRVEPNARPEAAPGTGSKLTALGIPQPDLASSLADAFRSDQTPPFGQMLGTLFSNSNGQQRAGILNQLLAAVGPNLMASGGLSSLAGLLRGGKSVTPEQAEQVPAETLQQLAEDAEKHDPSIVDQAGAFYAQHPTLVQALGAGALALIMSHVSRK